MNISSKKLKFAENVDGFISFWQQIWINLASRALQWILCSERVPSEWELKQLLLWCFY